MINVAFIQERWKWCIKYGGRLGSGRERECKRVYNEVRKAWFRGRKEVEERGGYGRTEISSKHKKNWPSSGTVLLLFLPCHTERPANRCCHHTARHQHLSPTTNKPLILTMPAKSPLAASNITTLQWNRPHCLTKPIPPHPPNTLHCFAFSPGPRPP